jgi:hypothetical protein
MNVTRRSAPIGLIAGAILIALATVGVAYGLWSKVIVVRGEVHTGDVNVDWTFTICSEFYGWPGFTGTGEYLGKDVGSFDVEIDPADNQILHITIHNGYPSYSIDCEVEWTNTGTIPVNAIGFAINPGPGLTNCVLTGGTQSKTLKCDQLTIVFVDNVGLQVDPGDTVASSMRLHVEQLAAQGCSSAPGAPCPPYTFTIVYCVAQWNEPTTYTECVNNPQVEGPIGP